MFHMLLTLRDVYENRLLILVSVLGVVNSRRKGFHLSLTGVMLIIKLVITAITTTTKLY